MTFEEYQKQSRKTALYHEIGHPLVYPVLGLVGESGEVAEKVKKLLRNDQGKMTPDFKENLTKELGDVLWYIAQLATELDISLDEIASQNIIKLTSRLERGTLHASGDER